jgi:sigma-E factor negative regulatory protein RseA
MTNANDQVSAAELLSALADGELDAAQAASLVQASRADPALLQTWASYHAIGQVLRAHASDAVPVFNVAQQSSAPEALATPMHIAANDSVFRWKLVAGVAALAAVGSMVWALVGGQGNPAGVQLAQRTAPAPAVVTAAQSPANPAITAPVEVAAAQAATAQAAAAEAAPVMIRDPHLDELLAAHKQFGGASALQQPAGFLRNATFQPARR